MKCRKRIKKLVRKCKEKKTLPSLEEILKHAEILLKESKSNRDNLRETLAKVEKVEDIVD